MLQLNKLMNMQKNSLSLELAAKKLIELNLIKPKTKIGLSSFLNMISKWRNDLTIKKMNHVKLMQIILMNLDILQC